jgi:hypothetical protein
MQFWQIEVMGGVMLEDGAERKVVAGLDQKTELQPLFLPVPWPGGAEDVVARRPSRRRELSREFQPGVQGFGCQPKEQSTMTLFRARSSRASS